MIEINLLPEEFKVKVQKYSGQSDYLLYIIPGLVVLLVLVHVYLGLLLVLRSVSFSALNKKWTALAPQREKVISFKSAGESLSQQGKMIRELAAKSIDWAKKQNKLSFNLPNGIWLNEVSLNSKEMIIQGTVVSLEKEEVDLINKFLFNLKNDLDFIKDFNGLELSSVQRKNIGAFEVADFVLIAALK